MTITASAPGKLVLCGDYAVLEGAPAVVLALDRRARVEVAAADEGFCVDAAEVDVHGVRGHLRDGRMEWSADAATADRLRLVTGVLEHLAQHGMAVRPAHLTLDTQAFFGAAGAKLGLGSSAALTVALSGALHAAHATQQPDVTEMIAIHRSLQGGRGSGLDIATSLVGGALAYRLRGGQPQVTQGAWPRAVGLRCVWSGRSASTGDALAHLADWRTQHPGAYNGCMDALTDVAEMVAAAWEAGHASDMVAGVTAYAACLEELGQASGIDIVCAEHRALAAMARACGVAYKTCGAGGGDVGVAIAMDDDRLEHFARQATAAGFAVLDAGVDPHGLSVQASN